MYYSPFCYFIEFVKRFDEMFQSSKTSLARDILSLNCRQRKNRANHKYKKNLAVEDCLSIQYPA